MTSSDTAVSAVATTATSLIPRRGRRRSAVVIVTNAAQLTSTSPTSAAFPSRVAKPITSVIARAETTSAAGAGAPCRSMPTAWACSAEPRLKSGRRELMQQRGATVGVAYRVDHDRRVARGAVEVRVPERGRGRVDDRCLLAAWLFERR